MHRIAALFGLLAVLLVFPSVASATHTDSMGNARNGGADLVRLETVFDDNFGYSEESGEPLTCSLVSMESTAWYRVPGGPAGPVTLTTDGSDFDTVLAVYPANGPLAPITCNDDAGGGTTSEVTFTAQGGVAYLVQVGGCTGNAACGDSEGFIDLTMYRAPGNDSRGAAESIPLGSKLSRDDIYATTESEPLDCGGQPYDATVWFRFSVPEEGDALVDASSTEMDPVVAVYRPGSGTPLACQDDAPGQTTSSSLPVRLSAGEYFVQVGAHLDGPAGGRFDMQVTFAPDLDRDNDGVNRPADCNDDNPAIRPGLPEVANNDVDENCDNIKAFDRDGDGHLAPPAGGDCDDSRRSVHPGARDVPGNKLNEDCAGRPARYRRVGATFSVKYQFYRAAGGQPSRLQFVRFGVRDIPGRSTVTLRCSGSRNCPARRITKKIRKPKKSLSFLVRFRRDLPAKTRIQLSVTRPERIGIVRVLRVREKGVDDRTLCKWPNQRKLRRCVGSAAAQAAVPPH